MRQTPLMRWTLVVIGALAFAGVLLALLVLINSEFGFVGCTGFTPYGWIIPLVAGVVLGLVVMLLMNHDEAPDESQGKLVSSACASCGESVMDEWRMCPHCGAMRTCDVDLHAPSGLAPTAREQ